MTKTADSPRAMAQHQTEALARTLRHEVGDLLQTVYAGVAILQERVPADWALERRVLADMRVRAELCKQLLDLVHDLVCPLSLTCESVDAAELAGNLVAAAAPRYPHLRLSAESAGAANLVADARRLAQIGQLLLANACKEARQRVEFHTRPGPGGGAEWVVRDDGPGVAAEDQDRLFSPLNTSPCGHLGIGLALVRKLVQLHGGRVTADNGPDGGFCVRVFLPERPPEPAAE